MHSGSIMTQSLSQMAHFFVLMGPWTPRCKVLVRTLKHFTWIGLKVFFGFGADMLHNMRSDICFLKKKSSDNSMKVIFHNNKEFGKHFMYNSNKTKKQILAGPKKKNIVATFSLPSKIIFHLFSPTDTAYTVEDISLDFV